MLRGGVLDAAVAMWIDGCAAGPPGPRTLPLQRVSVTELTGGPVRFDDTALDAARGRLFIAPMGASELIDVDVHARAVVRL